MKTKSKRFLKLATLCLALLSTTLLMTQPVKAETSETSGFYKARDRGETDGYRFGLSGGDLDLGKIKVPSDIEYEFGSDYKDAYEGGYERGRRAANPVGTFLEDVWSFLTYAFNSIFGLGQNTQ
ncbi:hypothetical protein [Streptococcus pyogenes]|uniref:hypothetical protein n=1 Tax=Streptococcus pyogenes TaxID=1314 RepID=UPI000E082F1A|nr:hypothetical protein [Streptococcus pyogenes]SUO63811.1 hypothetical membrane associated protein [Streptococcus pyogenes]VGQ75087.1 hypothetical membrane associated protein [Streptococcus pyogenes]VGQ78817.1 hypothetical membrane associated protein [Streptococcus pyogenes]VGU43289.1 hypothetical membrane associated protein [Streptococcus pyogenes]VGV47628.1 Uncharacterised protein [Streptococcus pyogenes]